MTYAVLSDIHAHAFTLFARTNHNGVNTRLDLILLEMERAADELLAAGGNTMIIAGDILHTRGQIDPEVLNPLRYTIEDILNKGIDIHAIPGNHDLKSAETNEVASSIQNLAQISLGGAQFKIHNRPTWLGSFGRCGIGFVPWHNTKDGLMNALAQIKMAAGDRADATDVFIHAGIDGVLSGMPAHGLTHIELGAFGFRRVFSGHYHNHKDFGNGVVSIGATTHHNWGDVGTRAGFLLVNERDGSFQFRPTEAPRFIDISGMDEDEMLLAVPGNYARFRGPAMTEQEVKDLREALVKMGALGTSIEVPRNSQVARSTKAAKAVTVEQSIEAFVKAAPPASVDPAAVIKRAIETLHETQAVAA